MVPEIVVVKDYDGYFERLVGRWCALKQGSFKHKKILITAGQYREAAVSFVDRGDELSLDFYSAMRSGFGDLSEEDVRRIIELL